MTERSVMVRIRGDVSDLNRALMGAGKNVRQFANDLETSNDRATWLAQGLTAIVPAVAPIAAQAAPAIAGLTTQLLSAGAAAGVTLIAFQGVGDAMKASLAYEAAPTAANLAKLQEAMQDLSPAAQEFVAQIDDLMPQLKGLRDVAASNMFPGMSQGLDDLITLLPQARALIGSVADENGRLAAAGAAALTGPEFRSFFDYVQRNAAPTTAELGRTIGNVTKGLAELLMAFEPAEQSWSRGMLNMSRSFEQWAAGVGDTKGFQEFLDYLETSGPQVLDTVGALSRMLLEVGEAAAPLGGPTLAGIRAFANAVSAIADSPLGPVIIGAAAAVSALSRALAVSELLFKKNDAAATGFGSRAVTTYKAQASAITQLPTAFRTAAAEQKRLVAAQTEARTATAQYVGQLRNVNQMSARGEQPRITTLGKLTDSLGKVELANFAVGEATKRAAAAEAARGVTIRQSAAGMGRTAAAAVGLTLATSGLADGMGFANTATLALAGSAIPGVGTAAGAAVGAFLDLKKAGEGYTKALDDMSRASNRADFAGLATSASSARQQFEDMDKALHSSVAGGISTALKTVGQFLGGNNMFNDKSQIAAAEAQVSRLNDTYITLARAMGSKIPLNASIGQVQKVAEAAAPALRQLGISADDLSKMSNAEFAKTASEIKSIMVAADSTAGRTQAFGSALRDLDNDMLSTADSASKMASALQALVGPPLDAEAAADKYAETLSKLKGALDNKSGFQGESKGALANRAVTRDYMSSLTDMLSKQAAAGASAGKIATQVRNARKEFIAEGVAAGKSAAQMRARANAIGLTPRLVRLVMQVVGDRQVASLTKRLQGIPRQKLTSIIAQGIPKSEAGMRALQKRYNLTPKQVRTLAALRDSTGPVRARVLAGLKAIAKTNPRPTASLNDRASTQIAAVRSRLAALNGTTAFTTAVTILKTTKGSAAGNLFGPDEARHFAGGGTWGYSPDVANGHVPHFARGGTNRVFAEPETQGEAYIPLANDWRRPRAKAIASETVRMLGGTAYFAGGGIVAGSSSRKKSKKPKAETPRQKAARGRLAKLNASLDRATKAVDRDTASRDALAQKRADLGSTVAGAFMTDPFAGGDAWAAGGGASPIATIKADIAKATAFESALYSLSKSGLKGDAYAAIAQKGDIAKAQSLAAGGRAGVAQYQALFNQRAALTASVGAYAGTAAYGAMQAAAQRTLEQALAVQKHTQAEIKGMRADMKHHAKSTGHEVGKIINSGASKAARNSGGKRR